MTNSKEVEKWRFNCSRRRSRAKVDVGLCMEVFVRDLGRLSSMQTCVSCYECSARDPSPPSTVASESAPPSVCCTTRLLLTVALFALFLLFLIFLLIFMYRHVLLLRRKCLRLTRQQYSDSEPSKTLIRTNVSSDQSAVRSLLAPTTLPASVANNTRSIPKLPVHLCENTSV